MMKQKASITSVLMKDRRNDVLDYRKTSVYKTCRPTLLFLKCFAVCLNDHREVRHVWFEWIKIAYIGCCTILGLCVSFNCFRSIDLSNGLSGKPTILLEIGTWTMQTFIILVAVNYILFKGAIYLMISKTNN
jgi:hypothetical protein